MKVIELLKLGTETLKMMSQNGIFVDDWKYVEAYEHFQRMRELGVKYNVAIKEAANGIHVTKRTLQRAFKRLSKEC